MKKKKFSKDAALQRDSGAPGSMSARRVLAEFGARHYSSADRARQQTRNKLARLDVSPSKQKGQNFLVSELVISSIIDFGRPSTDDYIIEIGPGLGALTSALSSCGLKAVIEIEPAFAREIAGKFPNLKIYETDARQFDFSIFKTPVTIFSNLPYSISSEMILALVKSNASYVKRIVLMLQKEFVERLAAPVGGSAYGILSVFCQRAGRIRCGPVVAAEYFHPRPKIDSQLIEIYFNENSVRGDQKFEQLFSRLVRAAFSKRRKTLLNSLLSSGLASKEVWEKCLLQAEIEPNRRAQELSWADYERLAGSYNTLGG